MTSAPGRRPDCSVVIPTYNGRHLLEVCLASVFEHLPEDLDVEVIVVDDASTDDTRSWVSQRYPKVRLVVLERNGGFVAAANAGLSLAGGRFIQLLNNDTEVTAGWIETGLAPFEDPRVGSVAPLVLVRSDPSRVDSAGDGYALIGWPFKRGHGEAAAEWTDRPTDVVFGASGSSAFYRASAIERVGGYDPAFGSYYEDVDLAFRLRWAGYSCVHQPRSVILHEVSASYDHSRPELQRRMARNSELLFWTNLPPLWMFVAFWPHLAFTLAQCIARLIRGRLRPFLLGKLDAVRSIRMLATRRALRFDIARRGVARPHFPLRVNPMREVRNHRRRPLEASRLRTETPFRSSDR
ncbi:MAG: glycosyltransferase family 2 protein [Isosphaeraceae bacterium]|nr:glycosyltransferase family 2 protein [Isosphaeraceae bacterium]